MSSKLKKKNKKDNKNQSNDTLKVQIQNVITKRMLQYRAFMNSLGR